MPQKWHVPKNKSQLTTIWHRLQPSWHKLRTNLTAFNKGEDTVHICLVSSIKFLQPFLSIFSLGHIYSKLCVERGFLSIQKKQLCNRNHLVKLHRPHETIENINNYQIFCTSWKSWNNIYLWVCMSLCVWNVICYIMTNKGLFIDYITLFRGIPFCESVNERFFWVSEFSWFPAFVWLLDIFS